DGPQRAYREVGVDAHVDADARARAEASEAGALGIGTAIGLLLLVGRVRVRRVARAWDVAVEPEEDPRARHGERAGEQRDPRIELGADHPPVARAPGFLRECGAGESGAPQAAHEAHALGGPRAAER